jgi:hypothetical protein
LAGNGDDAGCLDRDDGSDGSLPEAADSGSSDSGTDFDGQISSPDVGPCTPPEVFGICENPLPDNAGYGSEELCGTDRRGNGLDDDHDGVVDEGCICFPGEVHACFGGPPGKRHVGGCTDGAQTCEGSEFGFWGQCRGWIGPSTETCDKLDNDCNGCADDGRCCDPPIDCPAQGDSRIPAVQPFADLALQGGLFYYKGAAQSWKWAVTGGPCDQLFSETTGTPPIQSFALSSRNSKDASVKFTLSGDYTVSLTVTAGGQTYSCRWVQHVIGPGVRMELCWEHSGVTDLDLHVHRSGTTSSWFGSPTDPNPDDCNYTNCTAAEYPVTGDPPAPPPEWGYVNTDLSGCRGSLHGSEWEALGSCHNPRLDLDNRTFPGRPENMNIDNPAASDTFRILVHYFATSRDAIEEHPLVNIYCGGVLLATFGQAPDTLGSLNDPGSTFNSPGGWAQGSMWRVADVTAQVDELGNTTGCQIQALHPPGSSSGYWVTVDDTSY